MKDYTTEKSWSETINNTVYNGTKQQRLTLLKAIFSMDNRYLLAEYLIELMIFEDIKDIYQGDKAFLRNVLCGDDWVGYHNMSTEENIREFVKRDIHENILDVESSEFQHLLQDIAKRYPDDEKCLLSD